jgi:hypothetical protein
MIEKKGMNEKEWMYVSNDLKRVNSSKHYWMNEKKVKKNEPVKLLGLMNINSLYILMMNKCCVLSVKKAYYKG